MKKIVLMIVLICSQIGFSQINAHVEVRNTGESETTSNKDAILTFKYDDEYLYQFEYDPVKAEFKEKKFPHHKITRTDSVITYKVTLDGNEMGYISFSLAENEVTVKTIDLIVTYTGGNLYYSMW